jgi:NADH/F420H2 dehydrogenase subunit C
MDASALAEQLKTRFPDAEFEAGVAVDQPTIVVPSDLIVEVSTALRDAPDRRFVFLSDLTAVDWWPGEPRFEVVYHLVSFEPARRLRVKTRLGGENPHLATVSTVWPAANWLEREVYDLFGIVFDGHPDLRRLMMPDDWEGHPLRKDYPVQVKTAVKVYEPLQLSEQEFRESVRPDRERGRGGAGPGGS